MATDFGEIAVRSVQITNAAGAAVDADTLPSWTVTLPDGTAGSSPGVQHGTVGEYFVNYIGPQAGRYEDTWTATVGGLTAKFGPDVFHVRAAAPGPIVSLADVRRHLTIRNLDPGRDEQLRDFLDAATDLAEDYTGRTYRRATFVETYDGGGALIALLHTPVASITSIVQNGTAVTQYVLDPIAGTLSRGTISAPYAWIDGIQNITVTSVAGGPVVKPRVRLGVLELTRHLWETQRGGSNLPRQAGAGDDWDPRSGYSIPRKVSQMLDFDKSPGF